jgi:DNA mismatch repair protein MutS
MKNIGDLHFQKEIFPLMDFCYNEFSRDVLTALLAETPDSVVEIMTRQNILRALIDHDHLRRPFSYAKSEFSEVYTYMNDLLTRDATAQTHPLLYFFFARKARQREQGALSQLVLFLHKVHHAWFSGLAPDSFPWEFQNRIRNIRRMFADLGIERYHTLVRGRGLAITDIARLRGMVEQKCRNGEMDIFWTDFFVFEAFLSLSKGMVRNNFTFPSFVGNGLSIKGFYHPLLKTPVLNSIDIHDGVTLITGPNMSGKSTLLKSIGLCIYLAHLGLAVPAESCELEFFDVISVAINLNDDILSGYSHFMTEIQTLKNVVVQARQEKKCFAIFDELFRGTNVADALAISETTIRGLTQFRHCYFFISTHLHQLKETVASNANIDSHYIECTLIDNRPVFTYKLQQGWSDLRIGQIIFRREGLNELLRL